MRLPISACCSGQQVELRPFPFDEVVLSAAHFNIERLALLEERSVDSALAWLASTGKVGSSATGSLPRRALFSCMVERALPIPLDLLGVSALLLIDDEPAVLRSMARVLRQAAPALELSFAEGAKDALRQVAALKSGAVLVDAYMPETGGVEVCSRIRATRATAHVPVLAMTADPTPELAAAFTRAGAVAFLEKPVDAPALFEALSTHLMPNSAGDW
ncbi:MAG TPA: response regulator [Polyangiaceae bacterium]|nr:response regulator [Polyangiaceae bacterium]